MDPRNKPEMAFPWGEPPPSPGLEGADAHLLQGRFKMRLLCDPKEKPFVCSYTHTHEITKHTWDPYAQWLFTVQEGRVTAINRDHMVRDDQIAPLLNSLKRLIPSLEGYATSVTNDYWVVTHYGVQRERYSPGLQDEAKRKWMAKRKRDENSDYGEGNDDYDP